MTFRRDFLKYLTALPLAVLGYGKQKEKTINCHVTGSNIYRNNHRIFWATKTLRLSKPVHEHTSLDIGQIQIWQS